MLTSILQDCSPSLVTFVLSNAKEVPSTGLMCLPQGPKWWDWCTAVVFFDLLVCSHAKTSLPSTDVMK